MKKIPKKIKYLIYGLCILIFITLNFGGGEKAHVGLSENLEKLTDYYFGISTNALDYITIASIPLFGMLFNSTREKFKKIELVTDILKILFSVITIFGIGLYLLTFIGKVNNPLIPEKLLFEPYNFYSTQLIGSGIVISLLIMKSLK